MTDCITPMMRALVAAALPLVVATVMLVTIADARVAGAALRRLATTAIP